MRRADRLFQIVSFLQGRRGAVTARRIAEEFGVCERTIYRDLQDLMLSGVPVTGAAGVGYVLDKHYHLPPLMFDTEEIEAILLGISMVDSWTDRATSQAARRALAKVRNVLGERERGVLAETALFAPESAAKIPWTVDFSLLRTAIRKRRRLSLDYVNDAGEARARTVRPLALVFFGPTWLLLAWCELRQDFRNFRLDRMHAARDAGDHFKDERGKRTRDYFATQGYDESLRD
jgi:predicted DNA-binding transcriptional regulator YafY